MSNYNFINHLITFLKNYNFKLQILKLQTQTNQLESKISEWSDPLTEEQRRIQSNNRLLIFHAKAIFYWRVNYQPGKFIISLFS